MRSSFVALVIIFGLATGAAAQDQEYLIEGRDRSLGSFNGQLLIFKDGTGLRAKRVIHYLTSTSEEMVGPAKRTGDQLTASFAVHPGISNSLFGTRHTRPMSLTVSSRGSERIDTRCKQGASLRSTGSGILISSHPKNRLSAMRRQPTLAKWTHRYVDVPGKAFIKGQGDSDEVDLNDVRQGSLNNGYFMAGLAAVAHTDPQRIRSMIREEADGTFSVTVFRHSDLWETGVAHGKVKATRLVVDATFPSLNGTESPAYAWSGDQVRVGSEVYEELWPMLLEKAWAQHRGTYKAIEEGRASTPLSFFSAKSVWDGSPQVIGHRDLLDRFKYADQKRYPVTLGVPRNGGDTTLNVHPNHYYAFVGMDGDRVRLFNSWGTDHPTRSLSVAEVKRLFNSMHVGRF